MYKVKSKSWPRIIQFYRSFAETPQNSWLSPMFKFVQQIAAADFAQSLYGATSILQLRISYLPEFDPDKEVLNIDFDRKDGQFKFEYQETSSPLYKRWQKTCSPDQAFPTLVRFLRTKKWFFTRRDSASTV
jgi:hypothetical protein